MSDRLKSALAAALELTGTRLSDAAARMFLARLAREDEQAVLAALARAIDECKYRLSVADVLERLPGRPPSADAAWALALEAGLGSDDEHRTIVVPQAVMEAFSSVCAADPVGARMAFRERYPAALARCGARMHISLGSDAEGRRSALRDAVEQGLLTREEATKRLPDLFDDAPRLAHQRSSETRRIAETLPARLRGASDAFSAAGVASATASPVAKAQTGLNARQHGRRPQATT